MTPQEAPASWLLFVVRSVPDRLIGERGLPSQVDVPLLDKFLELGLVLLADVPGGELVTGVIGRIRPGYVKAAITFRFTGWDDAITLAETETRVVVTHPAAPNAFGRYSIVIHGFSGFIRRDWLRAVAHRASSAGAA